MSVLIIIFQRLDECNKQSHTIYAQNRFFQKYTTFFIFCSATGMTHEYLCGHKTYMFGEFITEAGGNKW